MDKPREYLKKMRTEMGLTMQDMGDALGMSRQYYNLIETGVSQKRMDITLVRRIADIFGVTLEDIARFEQAWLAEAEAEEAEQETSETAAQAAGTA